MRAATIAAIAAGALMAGLFFGFSTFTMGGLRRADPRSGLVVMQSINKSAESSVPFLVVFLGGAVFSVVLAVTAVTRLDQPGAGYWVAGAALNVAGLLVTMFFHVPRNNALDRVDPDAGDAFTRWTAHAATWTNGNHLRTVSYLASTIVFALALTRT